MWLAYFIVFEIAIIKQKFCNNKIKFQNNLFNRKCSVILSLFLKAHKGHQKTFEIGKNMREREREYLWNRRALGEKKKFLEKREQQLR